MFKLLSCATDHPKKLNKLSKTKNLEALFNHYKDRPGFKEYIDAQFDFAKLSEMYLSARPNGYRKESIYHDGCAIKARLAYLTYIVDIYFPINKSRPKRNKQMDRCEEIESLIDYTKPFMLNPDRQVLLTRFSKQTYKHLRDEHDWFNFEGLIAFKLIAAVVASSRGEDVLVLPSFTELPERVGRLRAARIVRKREREEVEGISPLPLKRRKKESLVTDDPSMPPISAPISKTQQIMSELIQQNGMLSQYALYLETLQTMNNGASSSQQILLSHEDLIANLNILSRNILQLKYYRDTVLYPALISDFDTLPVNLECFYWQTINLSNLENAVNRCLIQLTAPTPSSNQTTIISAASSQEPPVVTRVTQQEQAPDTAPLSETHRPETDTFTISTNTSPRFFSPSSPHSTKRKEDVLQEYLQENGDLELFGFSFENT